MQLALGSAVQLLGAEDIKAATQGSDQTRKGRQAMPKDKEKEKGGRGAKQTRERSNSRERTPPTRAKVSHNQEEGTLTVGARRRPMELEDGQHTLAVAEDQAAAEGRRQQQPPGQALLLQLEARVRGLEAAHSLFVLLPQHHLVAEAIIGRRRDITK